MNQLSAITNQTTCNVTLRAAMKGVMDFMERDMRIIRLKDRWLDERDYEDFEEYRAIITKILTEEGYTVKSVTKAFAITIQKGEFEFILRVGATKLSASARLLKA